MKKEPKTLKCVVKMQKLARKAMKRQHLTEEEVKRRIREDSE